jgi:hypothetical protein
LYPHAAGSGMGYSAPVIKDGDGNVMMSGVESIRGMCGQLFAGSPDLAVSNRNRMAIGEYVIHEELIDGFNLAGYPPQVHAVVVYRIAEGKVREVTLLM